MGLANNDRTARATITAAGFGLAVVLAGVGFANGWDDPKPGEAPQPPTPPKAVPESPPAPAPLKADDKKPDPKPGDVLTGPPPELAALRKAVEDAARKGENVDEIRKHLDALEKALTGKSWVKPKPVEVPPGPPVPGGEFLPPLPAVPGGGPIPLQPPLLIPGGGAVQPFAPFAGGPGGIALDPEKIKEAQELMKKAAEALAKDPNDPDALKQMEKARDLMLKAMRPGGGVVPPGPPLPGGGWQPVANPGRLGVAVVRVPAGIAGEADIPKGQGLFVEGVAKNSPAENAGLKQGDVILEFAGKPVTADPAEFRKAVAAVKTGEKVDLVVLRGGKKEAIKGVELPEAAPLPGGKVLPLPPAPGLVPAVPAPGNPVEAAPPADPALPPPAVKPLPPPPAPPALEPANPLPAGGGKNTSVQVTVRDGTFTLEADLDGLKVAAEGKVEGDKAVPAKITVTDGETKVEAASVEKLPAEYREKVRKVLDGVKVSAK